MENFRLVCGVFTRTPAPSIFYPRLPLDHFNVCTICCFYTLELYNSSNSADCNCRKLQNQDGTLNHPKSLTRASTKYEDVNSCETTVRCTRFEQKPYVTSSGKLLWASLLRYRVLTIIDGCAIIENPSCWCCGKLKEIRFSLFVLPLSRSSTTNKNN